MVIVNIMSLASRHFRLSYTARDHIESHLPEDCVHLIMDYVYASYLAAWRELIDRVHDEYHRLFESSDSGTVYEARNPRRRAMFNRRNLEDIQKHHAMMGARFRYHIWHPMTLTILSAVLPLCY